MSRFLKERLQGFVSYTPGEQPRDKQYVKLNTNESPYPPAPGVLKALGEADYRDLRLYPDPTGKALKEAVAGLYDIEPEQVFLSNGSDDILNFSFMAFVEDGEEIVFPDITYSFYETIADLHAVSYRRIPLTEDFQIRVSDYTGIGANIVLPNPNAPTGIALSAEEIEQIVSTNPDHLVLIDEAYVDFGGESVIPLIKKYDNLLVSQTFSKSRCFAGGRLGFAAAQKPLIDDLMKIQYGTNPYNVNRITQLAALETIRENGYYREMAGRIRKTRAAVTEELRKMGFEVLPSEANFILMRHDRIGGQEIYEKLKENGVLVRHFTAERIKDHNRVTIGSDEQMEIFLEKLEQIIREV